jgi:hypothetical protein
MTSFRKRPSSVRVRSISSSRALASSRRFIRLAPFAQSPAI